MTRWIITLGILVAAALFMTSPAAFAGISKLVFVRGGNVWIANTDGTEARQLTSFEPGQYNGLGPALAPDGQWVAFSLMGKGRDKQIYLLPSRGGAVKPLRPKGIEAARSPSFCPTARASCLSAGPTSA